MAARKSSSTEFELDDLNLTLDTVVFEDVQKTHQPDQDLFVIYKLNESFRPSSRDWIGLYHQDWENTRDYITFQWAQKQPRDANFRYLRSVLLQTKNLNIKPSDKSYQLLYVTKGNDVVGASNKFKIQDYCPTEDDATFLCVDRPAADLGIESLTFIESDTTRTPKGLLETFELIRSSSEPTSMEPPKPSVSYDNKTLVSNFDLPQRNLLELCATRPNPAVDPLVLEYLNNKERAIVPMAKKDIIPMAKKDIIPYSSYKPIYTVCHNGKDTGVDIEALLKPITTRYFNKEEIIEAPSSGSKRKLPGKLSKGSVRVSSHRLLSSKSSLNKANGVCSEKGLCGDCRKKKTQIKVIKFKMGKLEAEAAALKKEMVNNQESIDMKDVLLGELSNKVKILVQEHENLTSANEELFSEKRRLKEVITENKKLVMNKTKLGKRFQKINEENQLLATHIETLSEDLCEKDVQNATLTRRNTYLEEEMTLLKSQQKELEKYLDDILYTLSLQGYHRLVDTAGNITDLTKKKGSVLELQGWNMKNSKKIERHLATIAHQETTIEELQVESERLRMLYSENERKLRRSEKLYKVEQEKSAAAEKLLEGAEKKLDMSEEKEDSLSRLLINEKRQKLEMIKKYQAAEKALQKKVTSLVKALKTIQRPVTNECSTQAAQVLSSSGTQTQVKEKQSVTDASEALSKVCSYVAANIFTSTTAASAKAKAAPRSENTGRAHSSKWRAPESSSTSAASLSQQDPAVLSWADQTEQDEDSSVSEASGTTTKRPVVTKAPAPRVKKAKVFGSKAKKPRKFMFQGGSPGKATPSTGKMEYTPCVFGAKPAPFK